MSHPVFDLTDRVALVSGAASGMGKAMSIGFAESGAHLVLADINTEGMADTASQIEALGRKAIPVTCYVGDIDQIRAMFARVDKEFGRIDILGNIAGEASLGAPEDIA